MTTQVLYDRIHEVNLVFNTETLEWDYHADEEYVDTISSNEVQRLLENLKEYFTDPDWHYK